MCHGVLMVQGRSVQVLVVVSQHPCYCGGQPGRGSISSCYIPGKWIPCEGCLGSMGEITLSVSKQEGQMHSDSMYFNFEF